WKDLDEIFLEIQNWDGKSAPSAGAKELLRRVIRKKEVVEASNKIGEGLSSQMEVRWLDLLAPNYTHGIPVGPSGELIKGDVEKVKRLVRNFISEHRSAVLADQKEGIPLLFAVPHIRDSHIHHRLTNQIMRRAIQELKEEGAFRIGGVSLDIV